VLLFTLFVAAATSCAMPKPRAESASGSLLAFGMVDDETGNSAVYVIKDDGTGLRQMTPDGRSAHSPSWSPDHSRMTFCGDLDDPGNMDIYITDIAGQTFERITVETGIDCGPSWSPDGGSILYWHSNDDGDWTTRLFEIADGRSEPLQGVAPRASQLGWSPSSDLVSMTLNDRGEVDVSIVEVETGEQRYLLGGAGSQSSFAWSPAGDRFAMIEASRDGKALVVGSTSPIEGRATGEDRRQLIDLGDADIIGVAWSPDGGAVAITKFDRAFGDLEGAAGSLMVVDADSGAEIEVGGLPAMRLLPGIDWA
jgi:Tol biopolymer transport system component